MRKEDFLEVQIEIMIAEEVEILGERKAEKDLTIVKFRPEEITFYRSDPGSESDPIDRTYITFKNGESFNAVMTIEEFEKLIFNAE